MLLCFHILYSATVTFIHFQVCLKFPNTLTFEKQSKAGNSYSKVKEFVFLSVSSSTFSFKSKFWHWKAIDLIFLGAFWILVNTILTGSSFTFLAVRKGCFQHIVHLEPPFLMLKDICRWRCHPWPGEPTPFIPSLHHFFFSLPFQTLIKQILNKNNYKRPRECYAYFVWRICQIREMKFGSKQV